MRILILFLALASCGDHDPLTVPAKGGESVVQRTITKNMVADLFDSNTAQHGWDMTQPMVWGYFFADAQHGTLEEARKHLEGAGYEFVEYLQPEEQGEALYLHVRRIEAHTVESLHARNHELYDLAERLGVDTYDGMDVGLIDLDPSLKTNEQPNKPMQTDGPSGRR